MPDCSLSAAGLRLRHHGRQQGSGTGVPTGTGATPWAVGHPKATARVAARGDELWARQQGAMHGCRSSSWLATEQPPGWRQGWRNAPTSPNRPLPVSPALTRGAAGLGRGGRLRMLRLWLLSRLGRFCKQVESVPPCSWGEEVRLQEGGEQEGEGWETCGRATGAAGMGSAAPTSPRGLGWAQQELGPAQAVPAKAAGTGPPGWKQHEEAVLTTSVCTHGWFCSRPLGDQKSGQLPVRLGQRKQDCREVGGNNRGGTESSTEL